MVHKMLLVVGLISVCGGAEPMIKIETFITIPQTGANNCLEDDETEDDWAPKVVAKTLKRVARDLPMLQLVPKPGDAKVVEQNGKYRLVGLKKGALNVIVCQSLAQFGSYDDAASIVVGGIPVVFLTRASAENSLEHELAHVLSQDCSDPVPLDPILKTLEHVFKDVRADAKTLLLELGIGKSALLRNAHRYFAVSDPVPAAAVVPGSLK